MDYSVGKVLFSQFWFCQKWAGVCEGATTERCTRKGDNRPPIPLRRPRLRNNGPKRAFFARNQTPKANRPAQGAFPSDYAYDYSTTGGIT